MCRAPDAPQPHVALPMICCAPAAHSEHGSPRATHRVHLNPPVALVMLCCAHAAVPVHYRSLSRVPGHIITSPRHDVVSRSCPIAHLVHCTGPCCARCTALGLPPPVTSSVSSMSLASCRCRPVAPLSLTQSLRDSCRVAIKSIRPNIFLLFRYRFERF